MQVFSWVLIIFLLLSNFLLWLVALSLHVMIKKHDVKLLGKHSLSHAERELIINAVKEDFRKGSH